MGALPLTALSAPLAAEAQLTGKIYRRGSGYMGKWLQLLKGAAPNTVRVAPIHTLNIPQEVGGFPEMLVAAQILGLTLLSANVRSLSEFNYAFALMTSKPADALV